MGTPDSAREYHDYLRSRGLETDEQIGWLLDSAARLWPDREAVVFRDVRLTYAQLYQWTLTVAEDLARAGIRPGDRILWQMPNCLEGLVLHLAGWRIGAVCVPVVPLYREHEMAHILAESRPTVVAFSASLGSGRRPAEEMQAVLDKLDISPRVRYAIGGPVEGWSQLPAQADVRDVDGSGLPQPTAAADPCLIFYTSGTTSAPKGVIHCSRSLIAEARTLREVYGLSASSTFLMGAPITHIAGLLLALVLPAALGACTALLPAWDGDEAVRLADAEKATFCQGASVFLRDLVDRYERLGPEVHRLAMFMAGGSVVPPDLIKRADEAGIAAWAAWGMSEAPTTSFSRADDPLEQRMNTEGRPSPGTQIQAVDSDRRVLPPGEIGELRLRSPEQMLGYTNPEVQAAQVDGEGWFYTGDAGYLDESGCVVMTGRLKDIINRGGEKFSCQDIEEIIAGHPAVAEVAVLGVPDDRLGERVAAFVTLADGVQWPGDGALVAHMEQARVARQKIPVEWHVVESLPMTLSGKVQKHRLLETWQSANSLL